MMDKHNNIKRIQINMNDSMYAQAIFTTDQIISYPMPKANEIIDISDITMRVRLNSLIPKDCVGDRPDLVMIRGDIFVAGTVPSPNIELCYGDTRARILILDKDVIMNIIKENKNEDRPFYIGKVEIITPTDTDKGPQKIEIALSMFSNLVLEWSPIIRVSNVIFNASDDVLQILAVEACKIRDLFFSAYYGIQIALLNPVIAERFHRETIPYEDKTPISRKGNKKKPPKRYVKRITIDDLSDIEFSREKKAHHIKEPFWWVSGHWREYKSGKKIFIKGYWKGILRDAAEDIQSTPREREIVFEENDGKPYYK